ncbi:unnamed protein product [Orchesella dallaii]|uniref:Protein HGH1 homolog n=1 Tax=Orchesella dallaii TaxID=48710 RepID=A0ABP1R2B2_9HEXA
MERTKLETVAPFQDSNKGIEKIEGVECDCESCTLIKAEKEHSFEPRKYPMSFPKMSIESQTAQKPPISFAGLAECFGVDLGTLQGVNVHGEIKLSKVNFRSLIKIFTYLMPDKEERMREVILQLTKIGDVLLLVDLDNLTDDKIRHDFLWKMCLLFVMSWDAKENGSKEAEWCCWQTRRLLSYLLGFPGIAAEAKAVLSKDEFWPEIGPMNIFERLFKDYLYCGDTLALLCNLTRIDGMVEQLDAKTDCIAILKGVFYDFCRKIGSNFGGLGGLMLHLLVNLSPRIEGFSKFMITANHGYFMHPVLLDVLTNPETSCATTKAVWPFLKNLAMTDAGREALLEQLSVYLGPILYPIAGPEEIDEEDTKKLPPEVKYLPETKTRVKDEKVRECILHILFSLCRYRVGREKLRDFNVYQVLKHYHSWEEDPELQDKLESLVNILIRHEGSEIPFDDLMDGLNVTT